MADSISKDKLKLLISSNETEEAIAQLQKLLHGTKHENEATLLKSRIENLNSRITTGTINSDERTLAENKINESALILVTKYFDPKFDNEAFHKEMEGGQSLENKYLRRDWLIITVVALVLLTLAILYLIL